MPLILLRWIILVLASLGVACEPESDPIIEPASDARDASSRSDAAAARAVDGRAQAPVDREPDDSEPDDLAPDEVPASDVAPSDEDDEGDGWAAVIDASSAADEDASARDADGGAPSTPARDSFERAQRISVGDERVLVDERSAEQVDFFVFTAKAGAFYEITTDDSSFSPDNVVAVYDARRELVAENDDGSLWPGDAYDARLVMRAAEDGEYYVRVEDLITPPEFFESGFALLYYYLTVREVSTSTAGFVENGAGEVLRTFEEDSELGYHYVTALGQFDGSTATIDFAGLAEHALIARVHAGGVHGDGSSVDEGTATVSALDGSRLARIDRSEHREHIRPPVSSAQHRIELAYDGDAGENAFYAVDLVLLPDNPSEQREQENGRARGAETVTLSRGTYGRGLLLSRLPPGDVDYYQVQAQEGDVLTFSCEGEATGSGVRGLLAELRNAEDVTLGSGTEGEDGLVMDWIVTTPGTYYLRLSSETETSEILPWVRCAVFVG